MHNQLRNHIWSPGCRLEEGIVNPRNCKDLKKMKHGHLMGGFEDGATCSWRVMHDADANSMQSVST
jgi:hypothetical protein